MKNNMSTFCGSRQRFKAT